MQLDYSNEVRAELACYFLHKAGGSLDKLKLMKLMYLADRTALLETDIRITDDGMYSLPHGPVLSESLNQMIEGISQCAHWNSSIKTTNNVNTLISEFDSDSLHYIAPIHFPVIEGIWNKFGGMRGVELVHWTHKNLPEWKDPNGSSARIDLSDIYKASGYSEEVAEEIAMEIESIRRISKLLQRSLDKEMRESNDIRSRNLPTL